MVIEHDTEKQDRAEHPEYTTRQEIEMELEHWEKNYPEETARIRSLKIQLAEETLRQAKEAIKTSELHKAMQSMEDNIDDVPW